MGILSKSLGVSDDARYPQTNYWPPEPRRKAGLPAPAAEEPTAPVTAPADRAETSFTHELVLVGRKGLEVLEPVTGRFEEWSPASFVDHLTKNPSHKAEFYTSRKVFLDPKSKKARTMTAQEAIAFLRNSGRL